MAAGLTAVPAAIREDAAATAVVLTFTLEAAAAADESVRFTLVAPSEGTAGGARRGLHGGTGGAYHYSGWRYRRHGDADPITPINDDDEEGLKALGVRATLVSTGETLSTEIKIRDDETPSTAIELSADPNTLDENAPLTTDYVLTATLDGEALAEDATVHLVIDQASTATRDLDYAALFIPRIEIAAGSITGTVKFSRRSQDRRQLGGERRDHPAGRDD